MFVLQWGIVRRGAWLLQSSISSGDCMDGPKHGVTDNREATADTSEDFVDDPKWVGVVDLVVVVVVVVVVVTIAVPVDVEVVVREDRLVGEEDRCSKGDPSGSCTGSAVAS